MCEPRSSCTRRLRRCESRCEPSNIGWSSPDPEVHPSRGLRTREVLGPTNARSTPAGWVSLTCKARRRRGQSQKIAEELPAKLDAAYAAVKYGAPDATKVAVLGYGRFFGSDISCPAASGIEADEATWLNGVADNLDATIRARATAAGFTYTSSIAAFTGDDVCASTPYLNGASASVADAYHPTQAGHRDGLTPLVRAVIG